MYIKVVFHAHDHHVITVKLQRLVVPKRYRRNGYANIILKYLEKDALKLGYKKIIMDSALSAVGFYEKNNYIYSL